MGIIDQRGEERTWPGRLLPKAVWLLLATMVGTGWLAVVIGLQDAGYKAWVVLLGSVAAVVIAVVTGKPKELLLFGWVFSLTYNRQYYVFEPVVGYNGTAGPYVILADLCLLGLFAVWLYESVLHKAQEARRPTHFWLWYLPFAAVCFLSIFVARRPDWSLYEMLRVAKMGLVLLYVRYNFGQREWRLVLAALAAAVSFQSAVAIKEIATGRLGVIGAAQLEDVPDFVKHFEGGAFTGVRGVGTLAHPPYLACYLLLAMPVLLAVGVTARRRRAVFFGLAFLLGCGGLAATLSRWPWVVAAAQVGLVLCGLVVLRLLPLRRALGMACVGATVLMVGLVPVAGKAMDRLTGDLSESIDYRWDGIRASLRAIQERPWLGFGLNNTSLYITEYLPEMDWALVTEEFSSRTLHLRAPVSLGDGFLYVAEQTGILGLLAFVLLVVGGLRAGLRAVVRTTGEYRAVCWGLTVGVLGALAEQIIDTPLWVDPNLFTFVLYLGLLNSAPAIFPTTDARATAAPERSGLGSQTKALA